MVRWHRVISLLIALLLLFLLLPFSDGNDRLIKDISQQPSIPQNRERVDIYNKLPLLFIENRGQLDEKVLYYTKMGGQTVYLTNEGLVFDLVRPVPNNTITSMPGHNFEPEMERLVYHLNFIGANIQPSIYAQEPASSVVNLYIGQDPSKWLTNIPTYREIAYKDIYKNIDLKFCGRNGAFTYDFIVHPGGDIDDIRLALEGIENINLSGNDLIGLHPYDWTERVRRVWWGGVPRSSVMNSSSSKSFGEQ